MASGHPLPLSPLRLPPFSNCLVSLLSLLSLAASPPLPPALGTHKRSGLTAAADDDLQDTHSLTYTHAHTQYKQQDLHIWRAVQDGRIHTLFPEGYCKALPLFALALLFGGSLTWLPFFFLLSACSWFSLMLVHTHVNRQAHLTLPYASRPSSHFLPFLLRSPSKRSNECTIKL